MKCLLVVFAVSVSVQLGSGSCTEMCGKPGSPQNGAIVYEHDFDVNYTCEEGFGLWGGDKTRRCLNGTWTGNVPRCAEKREIKINKVHARQQAICYDFVGHDFIKFSFNATTIYSISWETNLQNWTESMREWPFDLYVHSLHKRLPDLVKGSEIRHFKIQDKNMVEVTFRERIANVFELVVFAQIKKSVICGVKIVAIETEDKCEEPDSPLSGQHLWKRNDSVATFKCDENFNLTSNLSLICVNGKWIGSQPKCIPQTQEVLIDSGKAEHLPTTTGVLVSDEEKHLDGSCEDQNLPKTTGAPMVDSGEAGHLPVIIGVPVGILLIAVVISATVYKKKLCSKMLFQLNPIKFTLLKPDELLIS